MRLPAFGNEPCGETTGFLFRHPCINPVTCQCDSCRKLTCERHTVIEEKNTYCTSCAQRLAGASGRSSNPAQTRFSQYRANDPFWYSHSYYRGFGYFGPGHWGHSYVSGTGGSTQPASDPDDFTEADTSSVDVEGDANFEQEIGGT